VTFYESYFIFIGGYMLNLNIEWTLLPTCNIDTHIARVKTIKLKAIASFIGCGCKAAILHPRACFFHFGNNNLFKVDWYIESRLLTFRFNHHERIGIYESKITKAPSSSIKYVNLKLFILIRLVSPGFELPKVIMQKLVECLFTIR
jgi:hypothetical protein